MFQIESLLFDYDLSEFAAINDCAGTFSSSQSQFYFYTSTTSSICAVCRRQHQELLSVDCHLRAILQDCPDQQTSFHLSLSVGCYISSTESVCGVRGRHQAEWTRFRYHPNQDTPMLRNSGGRKLPQTIYHSHSYKKFLIVVRHFQKTERSALEC